MTDVRPDSEETQRLLEQAHGGDRAAFEDLFARQQPGLRQLVELHLSRQLPGAQLGDRREA